MPQEIPLVLVPWDTTYGLADPPIPDDLAFSIDIGSAKAISGATNASPISITATAHGFSTGQMVRISGVGGNTAANGEWLITVVNADTFELEGSTGNGTYTGGGSAQRFIAARARSLTLGRVMIELSAFAWNFCSVPGAVVPGAGGGARRHIY